MVAAGYHVFAVNPRLSRYRDRPSVSGAKSDADDAKVLADLVRTERCNHRPAVPERDDLAVGLRHRQANPAACCLHDEVWSTQLRLSRAHRATLWKDSWASVVLIAILLGVLRADSARPDLAESACD
jgi:hypothetical protein